MVHKTSRVSQLYDYRCDGGIWRWIASTVSHTRIYEYFKKYCGTKAWLRLKGIIRWQSNSAVTCSIANLKSFSSFFLSNYVCVKVYGDFPVLVFIKPALIGNPFVSYFDESVLDSICSFQHVEDFVPVISMVKWQTFCSSSVLLTCHLIVRLKQDNLYYLPLICTASALVFWTYSNVSFLKMEVLDMQAPKI